MSFFIFTYECRSRDNIQLPFMWRQLGTYSNIIYSQQKHQKVTYGFCSLCITKRMRILFSYFECQLYKVIKGDNPFDISTAYMHGQVSNMIRPLQQEMQCKMDKIQSFLMHFRFIICMRAIQCHTLCFMPCSQLIVNNY